MARHVRLFGLASLLVVDRDREVDDLLGHPALERDIAPEGPLLNRLIARQAARATTHDGRVLLSFRPRGDEARARAQRALAERLDGLAARRPWPPDAIGAIARYVATGEDGDLARAALTYATAFPFLPGVQGGAAPRFDAALFRRVFQLYERLRAARRPFSPRGLFARLTGGDRRARREILALTGDEDYGLHAVAISLDNSLVVIENLRALASQRATIPRKQGLPLEWVSARTASELVLRQAKETFTLPHAEDRLPANTLVLFRMRRSLAGDTPSGYEFAAGQWSACPARGYLQALFAAVCEAAAPMLDGRSRP